MKANLKQNHSSVDSQSTVPMLQSYVSRRIGKMGSVVVKDKVIDLDKFFGTTTTIEESFDESFDKTVHDFELEANWYLQTQTGQYRIQHPFDE